VGLDSNGFEYLMMRREGRVLTSSFSGGRGID
jgi:hypothetical protein